MFRAELGNGDRERAIALLERLKERYVCASKERNWGLDLLLLGTFPKRCITGYEASCSTTRWHLGASRRSPSRLLLLRLDPPSFTQPQHLLHSHHRTLHAIPYHAFARTVMHHQHAI